MTETQNEKTYALFSTPNNKKLIAQMEAQGKVIIKIPPCETQKAASDQSSLEKLQNPFQFDWIIFPDVLAVDYFLQISEENEVDLYELDNVRICAYGEAVSDRLRFVQVHTDVLTYRIEDTEIVEAVKNYVGSETGLSSQKILILHSKNEKISIADKLRSEGANICELAIYQITCEKVEDLPKLKALIFGGAIDEFIFSAPEDLIYLKVILAAERLAANLFEQFTATNETIYKTLFENGIKPKFYSN